MQSDTERYSQLVAEAKEKLDEAVEILARNDLDSSIRVMKRQLFIHLNARKFNLADRDIPFWRRVWKGIING